MYTSLYIHIPFCQKKCNYCNFYSIMPDDGLTEKYIDQLISELEFYKYKDITIDTIYLGGGTPSLLPLSYIKKLTDYIFKNFTCKIKEFTIETNPCSSQNIEFYKDFGVNRLSIGLQSLDNNILKVLGRNHNSSKALETLERANKHYNNISADLIIGVNSNQASQKDFLKIKGLVKHISAYILKLEEDTPLYKSFLQQKFLLPDDDQTAQQYQELCNSLKDNGLDRYEISNFAIKGYESKHNLVYWQMGDYIGIGASAHSFFEGKRYYNKSSIKDYLNGYHIANGKQINQKTDRLFETIMLGLRLEMGIDVNQINKDFNIDFQAKYSKALQKIKPYINLDKNILKIKPEYMLLQNSIAVEFL